MASKNKVDRQTHETAGKRFREKYPIWQRLPAKLMPFLIARHVSNTGVAAEVPKKAAKYKSFAGSSLTVEMGKT